MDNKIKIAFFITLSIYMFVSCAFDGDSGSYEVKINDWAKVAYWLQDKNDTCTLRGFDLYPTQQDIKINQRYDRNDTEKGYKIMQMPNEIVYNNYYIISDGGSLNADSHEFYKIAPSLNDSDSYNKLVKIEQISKEQYDSIKSNCIDCKVMDKSLLKKIQYEAELEEKNSFPTKTVLFILLVVAYVFYKIRKKKKK